MSILFDEDVNAWGIPLLLERNIVNQEEIDEFLKSLRVSKPSSKKWVQSNLRNHLLRTFEEVEPVKSVENPPAWLKAAIQRGDELFRVVFSSDFRDEIEHVVDWLESDAVPEDVSRVSVPQAIKHAQNWLAELVSGDSSEAGKTKQIKSYSDGFSWVELQDQAALTREGESMGHCVGSYCERVDSGSTRIWSLRDRKGDPHCTIEITNGVVQQIKGKGNKSVVEKYHGYVKDILGTELSSYEVNDYELKNFGMIKIEGQVYDINALPEGLSVKGTLDLSGTSITSLPEGLSVKGDLSLYGCTSLKSLPEGLSVKGTLDLQDTSLTSLPEGLSVGASLKLAGCTSLTSLPEGLSVGGWLSLYGCTSLTSLPEGLSVGGSLNLSDCTSLTSLPEGLSVGGSLDLRGTPIQSLPEGLSVKGGLDLSDCTSLTSLPEGLSVGGWLNLSDCTSLTSLPQGLSVGRHLWLLDTSLASLPDDLEVDGNIYVDDPKKIKCSEALKEKLRRG